MTRYRELVLGLLVLATASTRVYAQSGDEGGDHTGVTLQQSITGVDEEARSLFEAGRTAFAHGRFDDALDHFQRAHELSGRHELLFNIAICFDRLRRDSEAAAAFQRYLDEVPNAANRAEVEGRIAQLGRPRGLAGWEGDATTSDGTSSSPVAPTSSESSSSSVLPILGWTSAGLAAASIVASIAFWVAADGEYATLERMCLPVGCPADVVHDSSVATLDAMTNVFLVSAIVFGVASGAIWTLHLVSDRDDVEVAIVPGGVIVRGRL